MAPPTNALDAHALRRLRDEYEQRLEASGTKPQEWHKVAVDAITSFREAISQAGLSTVKLGTIQCFAAGCEVPITYDDPTASAPADAAVMNSQAYHDYAGAKMRTGFETQADGSKIAAWFLFPPDVTPLLADEPGDRPN